MKEKRDNEELISYDELKLRNRMLKRRIELLEKELEKWKDTERKPINIDKELKTFIEGIVHSLKNELLLILEMSGRIQKEPEMNHKKYMETIVRSAQFSDILLSNLMDYLGYGGIVYKPFSFVEILEELTPLILMLHYQKNWKIQLLIL